MTWVAKGQLSKLAPQLVSSLRLNQFMSITSVDKFVGKEESMDHMSNVVLPPQAGGVCFTKEFLYSSRIFHLSSSHYQFLYSF